MLPTCGRFPASIGGSANSQGSCRKFGTIPIPVQKSIPKIISCRTSGTTNTSKTPLLLSNVTGTFTVPMHAVSEADARIQHSTSTGCISKPNALNLRHPTSPTNTRLTPESSSQRYEFASTDADLQLRTFIPLPNRK
jgi:hypothetical protein